MSEDANIIVKLALSAVVLLTSGLTSIGTAGVSGIVGLGALGVIWGYDFGAGED